MLAEAIKEATNLVSQGEILKAIEYLKMRTSTIDKLQLDLTHLESLICQANFSYHRNLITQEEFSVEISKANYRFLNIILEYTEGTKSLLTKEIVIDKVKMAKAAQDYKERIRLFKSADEGANKTMEEISDFFSCMADYAKNFGENAGIKMVHLVHPHIEEPRCLINFDAQASLMFCWMPKTYIFNQGRLICVLRNKPGSFNEICFELEAPRTIKYLEFEPTISMQGEIRWTRKSNTLLGIDEVKLQCFDLIAEYLYK